MLVLWIGEARGACVANSPSVQRRPTCPSHRPLEDSEEPPRHRAPVVLLCDETVNLIAASPNAHVVQSEVVVLVGVDVTVASSAVVVAVRAWVVVILSVSVSVVVLEMEVVVELTLVVAMQL